MLQKKKIVFLYTELAQYFLACVEELCKNHPVEVHIVKWEVNKEAPFQFKFPENVNVYDRDNYSDDKLGELLTDIGPNIIYCSGWIDKGYVKICRKFKARTPVIVGIDNQWRGDLKQRIGAVVAPFTIRKSFTHAWVAGESQRKFASKLGFPKDKILTGFYSADTPKFEKYYQNNIEIKNKSFPHRFIYMGRYYDFKGIKDLWEVFLELKKEEKNDWELWCFGTGDIEPFEGEGIKHFGFVQPDDFEKNIAQTGVFVLPSHEEPWGVVVHEFAASGYPMILSDEVGAKEEFLEEGRNGYVFRAGNKQELKKSLQSIMTHTDKELISMSEVSHQLSKKNSPEIWATRLMKI